MGQNASFFARGADLKKVTCEVSKDSLQRRLIFDFGDCQLALDERAIQAGQLALTEAAEAILEKARNAPPGSPLRVAIEAEMAARYAEHVATCPDCGPALHKERAQA